MGTDAIKVTEDVVSCSDNGQHPLVYISLKDGQGSCHYCGQVFIRVANDNDKPDEQQAA